MADVSIWQLLLVVNKVFIYICIAATLGGPATLLLLNRQQSSNTIWLKDIYRYCILAAIAGLLFLVTYLLLETAAFSELGIAGLFDIETFLILWDSAIGETAFYRICGFMVFLFITTLWLTYKITPTSLLPIIMYFIMAYCFARSFSLIGHSSSLHVSVQALLSLHVLTVMIWLGSLYPLWLCCYKLATNDLHQVMHRFGFYASFVISLLVVAGAITAYQLITSLDELINSQYGQWFMLKLLLSIGLLSIAALHKWLLVPKLLTTKEAHKALARSIRYEVIIAMSILFISTLITTLVGPKHLM